MKLTKRQRIICENIPNVKSFADIGCDHGLISYFVATNIANVVYATDISKPSLHKAEILCKDLSNVEFILTDGLKGVPKVECVCICGMGGMEIKEILINGTYKPKYLVLQPMRDSEELRRFLKEEYKFIKDFTFIDKNKFYDLMVLKRGKDKLTKNEISFGRTNLIEKSEDFIKKLEYIKKEKIKLINKGINIKENQKMIERINKIYED